MIKIYSVHYIKPDFIDIQYNQLKKHCKDVYQFIVVNNGLNENEELIRQKCHNLNIQTIDIESKSEHQYQSASHSHALEHVFKNHISKNNPNDVTVIIDSDVFAFKDFSFTKILDGNLIAGMYQQRDEYEYLSSIFTIICNSIDLTNFTIHGMADTGSGTNKLINQYSTKFVKHTAAIDIETDHIFKNQLLDFPYLKEYRCQFIHDCFIHYYRGSNWSENDPLYHDKKLKFVQHFINHPSEYNLNLSDLVLYDKAHSNKGYNGNDHNYKNYKFKDI